jgi:hypothetical protein
MNIDPQVMNCFKIVETPEDARLALENFEWEFSQIDHTHCKVCGERAVML